MKERYESPVAELVEVACEDVILASGDFEDTQGPGGSGFWDEDE